MIFFLKTISIEIEKNDPLFPETIEKAIKLFCNDANIIYHHNNNYCYNINDTLWEYNRQETLDFPWGKLSIVDFAPSALDKNKLIKFLIKSNILAEKPHKDFYMFKEEAVTNIAKLKLPKEFLSYKKLIMKVLKKATKPKILYRIAFLGRKETKSKSFAIKVVDYVIYNDPTGEKFKKRHLIEANIEQSAVQAEENPMPQYININTELREEELTPLATEIIEPA